MDIPQEVTEKIISLKRESETLLIGIDGFGGSGKSSLARLIKQSFSDAYIVEMDDFYTPSLGRADFQRVLDQVIKPLKDNQVAVYQIYDWKNDSYSDSQPINPGGIVIIEGVFSLTEELIDDYDIKIWVDCDPKVGLERGVARDGEEVRDKWINIWMPPEKEYSEQQRPQDKADFIIDDMKSISHDQQQKIWDAEHGKPYVLKQMDSSRASSGVLKFWDFLKYKEHSRGIEMGCGKGRNVIWLAKQGVQMTGLDFAPTAIAEAEKRALEANVQDKAVFTVQDTTTTWPFENNSFDFGIDCFATTDIESVDGRKFTVQEMLRVLKPGGYLLAYLLSTEDEFHKEMITKSPASERNAFLHPTTGKFEKTYDEQDIRDTFQGFSVVQHKRIAKQTEFFGKQYACLHHWIILKSPR